MRKFLFPLFILVCLTVLLVSCNAQVEFEVNFIVDGEVYATVGTGGEETIKMPENPTKEGYTFDGWFWDNDIWLTPFTANSLLDAPLSSDMSVYAKWKANEPPIPPLQGTEIRSKELTLSEDKLIGSLSNATETFSFLNDIEVAEGATYVVARDIGCEQTIASKTVSLEAGDNVYYILVTNGNAQKLYTAMIRRRPVYTVTFNSLGGSEISTQSIEEMFFAENPAAPTKLGYTFIGWDYDFADPITGNITITAQYKVKEEMSLFNFISSATTCVITGIKDKSVTNITIPDYVTSIRNAFQSCTNLTSIVIPNSVTSIGNAAFTGCRKLVEVINKSNLTITKGEIDNGAVGRYALEVHTGESKIVTQNGYLFYTYDGVNYLLGYTGTDTELTLPDNYNGNNYTIYQYAFYCNNSLTSVTIPDSVTSIGNDAFTGCRKLVEVINKSNLTITKGEIDNGAVGRYALEVHTGESKIVTQNGYLFYTYYGVNYLLGYTGTDTELTLPDNYNGNNYTIYKYAFYCNNSLTSVTIGNSVTSIGDDAFYGCENLTSVTIGNSVTSIGDWAFSGCYKLAEVINKSNLDITKGSTLFGEVGRYALKVHTGESKIVTQNGYLFYTYDGVNYLIRYTGTDTELTLPDNYNGNNYTIYQYAFYDNDRITSVTIPNSVTSIGNAAFAYCYNLTSVTIPDSVTSIGNYAFYCCENLTSITIPDSVTSIGDYAFYACDNLTSVTIGNGVTSIGDSAFRDCDNLTSVTIGNGVTSIGDEAFYYCTNLTSIEYIGTQAQWDEITKGYSWDYNTGNYTITYYYTGE